MMKKIAVFFADGCEEIEGLTVVDLLRRSKLETDMISIHDSLTVTGSHKIAFQTDKMIREANLPAYDGIVLPGGIPGTPNLAACPSVTETVKAFAKEGKLVAAICAAPSVLGQCGVLEKKHATSYPGFAPEMTGCIYEEKAVVTDGSIITSRGMGTAVAFGLAIVAYFLGQEQADQLADKIMYEK